MWDKILKVLISFTMIVALAVTLKPKQEAHAIAPLVPLLVYGAEALVVDVAMKQGWKYAKKTGLDAKMKKVADDVVDNVIHFDFANKKPIKTKDGKVKLDVSANDRAKIARKLADEAEDIIEADDTDFHKRKTEGTKYSLDVPDTDPLANTSINLKIWPYNGNYAEDIEATDFYNRMYNVKLTPVPYAKKTKIEFISIIDGSVVNAGEYSGGTPSSPVTLSWVADGTGTSPNRNYQMRNGNTGMAVNVFTASSYDSQVKTWKAFNAHLKALVDYNTKIYYGDGLMIPESIKNTYPAPLNMAKDFKLPNHAQLSNQPIEFDIPGLPTSGSDVEIEWEQANTYIDEQTLVTNVDNRKIDMDVTNNNNTNYDYSQTVINNYYNDKTFDTKAGDVTVIVDITLPPDDDDGSGGGAGDLTPVDDPIEVPKSFFKELYEMAQKIEDMYDGVVVFLQKSVEGMKDLTEGTVGLANFLDDFFDWLPSEFKTLLGSALMLGVVAFFLRR